MTSIMAACVGTKGRVYSFEPHPQLYQELLVNSGLAAKQLPGVNLEPRQCALLRVAATLSLDPFREGSSNRGTSSVSDVPGKEGNRIEVMAVPLDEAIAEVREIGLLKVDVEGHEFCAI